MSLSGGGGSQYAPECGYLLPEIVQVPVVVHDDIGRRPALLGARLGVDPRRRLCPAESVARDQPLDLSFMININRDHYIEILLLAGLDEQRNDMDYNCVGIGGTLQLCRSGSYDRMNDPLEVTAGNRVGEDDGAELRPVEFPVAHYLRTEPVNDCGKRWRTRLYNLAGEHVRVDDHRSARRQLSGYQAFPRRDTARQGYPQHCQPKQLRVTRLRPSFIRTRPQMSLTFARSGVIRGLVRKNAASCGVAGGLSYRR
jgi:hypothetical protein